jgi:cephalosporin hydroxylase
LRERRDLANAPLSRDVYRPPYSDEIDRHVMAMAQGAGPSMHWKGQPLFKTVFDFSLYSMMIWDVKPRSLIEIGSGTGASAVWMADLAHGFGLDAHVYSMDIDKPDLDYAGVTFIEGDSNNIAATFSADMLDGLPHPWILIEDAHVNVLEVAEHFSSRMVAGDYVVIEDSRGVKQETLTTWTEANFGIFKIDTHYTDFFGRNATCSPDSIFVRR